MNGLCELPAKLFRPKANVGAIECYVVRPSCQGSEGRCLFMFKHLTHLIEHFSALCLPHADALLLEVLGRGHDEETLQGLLRGRLPKVSCNFLMDTSSPVLSRRA